MKGLICSVYHSDDFTDPLSIIHTRKVTLIGESVEGPIEPSEEAPAVILMRRQLEKNKPEYLHAEPTSPGRYMASGKFIWTSDSRFPNPYPISLYDRVE
jgi:hypothetical protein